MRLAFAITALAFCVSSAVAEIRIGVAGPMTGVNAGFGDQMKRGAEAAIAAINKSGGINGENLILSVADDGCDAKRAVAAAEKFASEDVRMVAGHFCSGASLAAATVYEQRGIVMISPSATAPKLTENNQTLIFRMAQRDDAQATIAATRIKASHPTVKIAFITDGTAASDAMQKRFVEILPDATIIKIKPEQERFADLIESVVSNEIAVAYFATSASDAGRIVSVLSAESRKPELYGADSVLNDAFWEMSGVVGEGMLVTFAADPTLTAGALELRGKVKGSIDGAFIPTYAAIEAFANVARKSNVNDATVLAQALRAGSIETALGPLQFDVKGDVSPQRFQWLRWSQGSFAAEGQSN